MKVRRNLFFIFIPYLASGLFFLNSVAYYTDSPDTVFYLTIAKKYATGNFYAAINNYWSPLISWLLVPFQLFRIDPLIAFKVVQLLLGGTGLVLTIKLSDLFVKNEIVKKSFGFALVPVFLSYALLYQTPDLLFLCLLLLLILQMIRLVNNLNNNQHIRGTGLGITGGALYLAKAFGFPFFLASLVILLIFSYFNTKEKIPRQIIYRISFKAFLVFAVISISWMYCLKVKYGTWSTGYASVYNFNLLHPDIYKPGITSLQHPVLTCGLMDISSHEEASAWESPGNSHQRSWSPFESLAYFKHYLAILKSNLDSFYYFIIKRNVGLLFSLSLALYFILIRSPFSKISLSIKLTACLLFVFITGYAFVFFMPRYLWLCCLILPLLSFYLWEHIVKEKERLKYAYILFAIFTLFILIKKPVKELLFRSDNTMSTKEIVSGILNLKTTLNNSYSQSMAKPALIEKVKSLNLPKGKVAGIRSADPAHLSYTQSLLLCMYLDQPFYGELRNELNEEEKLMQLRAFEVDYVYCWGTRHKIITGTGLIMDEPLTEFRMLKLIR